MKPKALLTWVLGLLMLGAASAQGEPVECELFGCDDGGSESPGDPGDEPSDEPGDEPADDPSDEPGDEPADELTDEVADLALPAAASDNAVETSAGGLATANAAREDGRGYGQSRAGK